MRYKIKIEYTNGFISEKVKILTDSQFDWLTFCLDSDPNVKEYWIEG
jgi:hypothetical protein